MKINANGRMYIRWIERPVQRRFIKTPRILELASTSMKKFNFCISHRTKPRSSEFVLHMQVFSSAPGRVYAVRRQEDGM